MRSFIVKEEPVSPSTLGLNKQSSVTVTFPVMANDNIVSSQPLGPNDLPKLSNSYRLNGHNNYLHWSQLVRTILKGRKKLGHIEGNSPAKTDPGFESWDVEDALIMTWLWHSMASKITFNYMLFSTAREIWDNLAQTYSIDIVTCYEIESMIFSSKQGSLSVTKYYETLSGLWNKLDQCQSLRMSCSADSATLTEFFERGRIFKFLSGLNSEYNPVCIQIFGKEKLPSLVEVFHAVCDEETRRFETENVSDWLKRKEWWLLRDNGI